eukprot:c38787_g1_i1 orf=453-878(+)
MTTTPLFPALREKASICYGNDAYKKALEVLETYGLPDGILPLEDIIEAGWIEETGFVWIATKKKQQHHFRKAERICIYDELVTCYMEKNKLKSLKGVKVKDLFTLRLTEIYVDEANPPKIHFKSIAGLSRSFPVEYFRRGA